jgi:hypothetical protein
MPPLAEPASSCGLAGTADFCLVIAEVAQNKINAEESSGYGSSGNRAL